jgi:hypothetical protein
MILLFTSLDICYQFAFIGCGSGIITEDLVSDSLYNEADYVNFKQGPCKIVPIMFKPNVIIYGQFLTGYSGDFDCWSDVYEKHGIRISPNSYEGRAWFDFGPTEKDTIKVTIQWVDNAWLSFTKKLQIYNWKQNKWITLKTWKGNAGEEYITTVEVLLNLETKDKNKKIRIAIYSSGFAIIHLNSIKIN